MIFFSLCSVYLLLAIGDDFKDDFIFFYSRYNYLSLFSACSGHFGLLDPLRVIRLFVFQIGEGGCVGTYYNGKVK